MKKINIKNNTNELFSDSIIQENNERNTKRFFTKFGVFFIPDLFASIISIFADSNPDANDDENDNIRECQYDQIKCSGKIEAQVFEKSSGSKNVSGGVAAGKDVCNVSGHHADGSSSSGKTINHHVTYSPTSINIGSAGITNISSFCSICDYKVNGKALVYEAKINCPTEWILGKEYTASALLYPNSNIVSLIPHISVDTNSKYAWSITSKILKEGNFNITASSSASWYPNGGTLNDKSFYWFAEKTINVRSDLECEIEGLEDIEVGIDGKYKCIVTGGYGKKRYLWQYDNQTDADIAIIIKTEKINVEEGQSTQKSLNLTVSDMADISKKDNKDINVFKWGVEISEGDITKGEYFETVPIAYGSTSPTVYERSITLGFDLSLIVGVAKWVQIAIGANASYTKTVNLEANLPSSVEGKGPGDIYNVRYYKIYRDVTLTRYYKKDGKKINGESKVVKWMGYMQYPDESFWSK